MRDKALGRIILHNASVQYYFTLAGTVLDPEQFGVELSSLFYVPIEAARFTAKKYHWINLKPLGRIKRLEWRLRMRRDYYFSPSLSLGLA